MRVLAVLLDLLAKVFVLALYLLNGLVYDHTLVGISPQFVKLLIELFFDRVTRLLTIDHIALLLAQLGPDLFYFVVQSLNLLIDQSDLHVVVHIVRLGEDLLGLFRDQSCAGYVNARVALVDAPLAKHELLVL